MSSSNFRQVIGYSAIVGAILGALRRRASIDQRAMATKLGITQSAWSRIETGASHITVGQLAAAARALDETPSGTLARADALTSQLSQGGVHVASRSPQENKGRSLVVGGAALAELASDLLAAWDRKSRAD